MSLLDWNGEKNATSLPQEDNAYVPKKEHEELKKLEEYRQAWEQLSPNDWPAIKSFIDENIASTTFQKFMNTAKNPAGVMTFKMKPKTYYKWIMIQGSSDNSKGLGAFIENLIDRIYENMFKDK